MIVVTEEHGICVYESSHDARIKCLDKKKRNIGVQLLPFWQRVDNYEGPMSVRRLKGSASTNLNMEEFEKLRAEFIGAKFEENFWQLLRAWDLPFFRNLEEDHSSLFCSELIAAAYQALGLLCKCKPSNTFKPKDYSEKGKIRLLNAYFGPEIKVKY